MSTLRRDTPRSLNIKDLHTLIDPIEDYNIRIHTAATWYAQNRIAIVPFTKYGFPKGLSQRHASYSHKKIDEWWHPVTGKYTGAGIAMAHGGQSGFCAIDLDIKEADGIQNLSDLQAAYGQYDDLEGEDLQTLTARTPSGGVHLVFLFHPEINTNSEFCYPGIDTRGGLKRDPVHNGGITFIEPTAKPDGSGYYKWDESITEIKDVPQWLVDVLNGRTPQKQGGINLQSSYAQSAPGDHGDGRDRNIYMDLMRFVGIGYTEDDLWALKPAILERMDPPDEAMVDRKIQSAIESDAFKKAQEEKETATQVNGLKFRCDKNGLPIKCIENLEKILSSAMFEYEYGLIEYDDFMQGFVMNKEPLACAVDWSIGIQSWISRKFKMDFDKTSIRDKTEYMAYSRPHSNVAREYMLSCAQTPAPDYDRAEDFWGSGRRGPGPAFMALCKDVLDLYNPSLHVNYDEVTREAYMGFLWFWLQGVCARACVPGCKMEIVLNIFGGQGIGKSLFFSELCPNPSWFTDSLQDSIVSGGQNNRDELLKLKSRIIVEMPELSPVKRGGKSADDKLKQFLSTRVDDYRDSYGRDVVGHPRTCALAGTSNNNDVYRDPTGARRFISIDHGNTPIRVGDCNNGVLDKIRDELWGEVSSSFAPGELDSTNHRLLVVIPKQLREMQNIVNSSHRFEEIGIQDVVDWIKDKSRVTWGEIVSQAKEVPGLRDAKESMIMAMVRKELSNNREFEFKKRCTRIDASGNKEVVNCWVNLGLKLEKDHGPGLPVPPHWSSYTSTPIEDQEY